MALAGTQTVTYDGTATTLSEVGRGMGQAAYASADGSLLLEIKHQKGSRNRSVVKLTRATLVANPFNPTTNIRISNETYLVINAHPSTPIAELIKLVQADVAFLAAGSYANLNKIVGGES